jgi:hypothetical protein
MENYKIKSNKKWIFLVVFFVFLIFFVSSLFYFMKESIAKKKEEWKCEAIPPKNSLNEKIWEIVGFDHKKENAKKYALDFCNKLFKTNKCIIKYCEKNEKNK